MDPVIGSLVKMAGKAFMGQGRIKILGTVGIAVVDVDGVSAGVVDGRGQILWLSSENTGAGICQTCL